MYYSNTANDVYSSSSRGRESGEIIMGPENRSAKHVKHSESRTHSTILLVTHQPTPPTHPPTQQPIDAPTYPPTMCYSNTAEYTSSRCVDDSTNRVSCSDTGIYMYLRLSATPGSVQTLPREAPVRQVVHRRPFFRRQIVGLLCGKGVELSLIHI